MKVIITNAAPMSDRTEEILSMMMMSCFCAAVKGMTPRCVRLRVQVRIWQGFFEKGLKTM